MAVEKTLLDEILENHKEQQMIEFALTQQAGDLLQGMFGSSGIYNIPRKSGIIGIAKEDWGALCDAVHCKYKGKDKHVHTLGIGIAGAQRLMSLYGKLEIDPEEPKIVEGDGEKLWSCKVNGIDGHNGNKISLTYMQSATLTTYDGKVIKNEYMPMIVQSKAIRNVILFLTPGDVKIKWIEDYQISLMPKSKTEDVNPEALFLKAKSAIDENLTVATLDEWQKKNAKNIAKSPNKQRIEDYLKQKRYDITVDVLATLTTYDPQLIAGYLSTNPEQTAINDCVRGDADAIKEVTEYLANYKASLDEKVDSEVASEEVETAVEDGQTEMVM